MMEQQVVVFRIFRATKLGELVLAMLIYNIFLTSRYRSFSLLGVCGSVFNRKKCKVSDRIFNIKICCKGRGTCKQFYFYFFYFLK